METLDGYLERLASGAAVPGGGSAAPLVAAMGAALAAMVARICLQNPRYAEQRTLAEAIARRADGLREKLLWASQHDEAAFGAVVAAQGRPKDTAAERETRQQALQSALECAAEQPLHAAQLGHEVLSLVLETLAMRNANLASDAGCAAEFAAAAIAACAYNVRVNHRFMHDNATIAAQAHRLRTYETEAQTLLDTIRTAVAEHMRTERPA